MLAAALSASARAGDAPRPGEVSRRVAASSSWRRLMVWVVGGCGCGRFQGEFAQSSACRDAQQWQGAALALLRVCARVFCVCCVFWVLCLLGVRASHVSMGWKPRCAPQLQHKNGEASFTSQQHHAWPLLPFRRPSRTRSSCRRTSCACRLQTTPPTSRAALFRVRRATAFHCPLE